MLVVLPDLAPAESTVLLPVTIRSADSKSPALLSLSADC